MAKLFEKMKTEVATKGRIDDDVSYHQILKESFMSYMNNIYDVIGGQHDNNDITNVIETRGKLMSYIEFYIEEVSICLLG